MLPFSDSLQKRKFADLLGPQWSKDEVEQFYEAYRKYGKDWKKVSTNPGNGYDNAQLPWPSAFLWHRKLELCISTIVPQNCAILSLEVF